MIVVTATLIFLLLIFAPIYLSADIRLYLKSLSASVGVKVGAVQVFCENISLVGDTLQCKGTVSTDVSLSSIDRQSGVDLLRCITVEKLVLSVCDNFYSFSAARLVSEEAILALATVTACNLFHCQIFCEHVGTYCDSCLRLRTLINLSVAELSFCLLKQGVRKWKTRKSEK